MRKLMTFLVAGVFIFAAGCGPDYKPMPYVPRDCSTLKPLVCHDGIGHIKGNKPWIMGGKCCCTPTKENYEMHIKDGTIDKSVSYEDYLNMYKARGITTDLDHKHCNNFCKNGPHVTMGGKCMATPEPGSANYRIVTYGPHENLMAKPEKKKKK